MFVNILDALYVRRQQYDLFETQARQEWEKIKCLPLPTTKEGVVVTSECSVSSEIIRKVSPTVLTGWKPQVVYGDGNCLFRSVSFACFGTEAYHTELRARAAIEVALNRSLYDSNSSDFSLYFHNSNIVCPTYGSLCEEVSKDSSSCGIVTILALSAVIGRPIRSFFPPLQCAFESSPYTMLLVGRNVSSSRSVVVMWSSTNRMKPTGEVNINHFVPLISVTTPGDHVDIVVSDDEVSDPEVSVGCFSVKFFSDADSSVNFSNKGTIPMKHCHPEEYSSDDDNQCNKKMKCATEIEQSSHGIFIHLHFSCNVAQ